MCDASGKSVAGTCSECILSAALPRAHSAEECNKYGLDFSQAKHGIYFKLAVRVSHNQAQIARPNLGSSKQVAQLKALEAPYLMPSSVQKHITALAADQACRQSPAEYSVCQIKTHRENASM